jgi:hypothetical protein
VRKIWKDAVSSDDNAFKSAYWDEARTEVIAMVWADNSEPYSGVAVPLPSKPPEIDLVFVRSLVRVFNTDVKTCSDPKTTEELWLNLQESQVSRAIGRSLGFDGHDASRWLRTMESSMSLTYEGRPIRHAVIIPKKFGPFQDRLAEHYVPFSEAIEFDDAILQQKWVRAVVDGYRVALAATKKHRGRVRGFVSMSTMGGTEREEYVPHESLLRLQSVLTGPDVAFIASPYGDLWVLSGRNVFWQKTQGRWKYLNYQHVHQID